MGTEILLIVFIRLLQKRRHTCNTEHLLHQLFVLLATGEPRRLRVERNATLCSYVCALRNGQVVVQDEINESI